MQILQNIIIGGFHLLMHHLAGTQMDGDACKSVTDEVKNEMLYVLDLKQKIKEVEISGKGKRTNREDVEIFENIFKRGITSKTTTNQLIIEEYVRICL